jgi:hypothetical protein
MTINFTTLFTRIGKALKVAKDMDDTAAAALVTNLRVFEDLLDAEQADFQQNVLGSLESTLSSSLSSMGSISSSLVGTPIRNLIIETVHADVPMVTKNIDAALTELIDQMLENGQSVDKSTVAVSVDYGESLSSSIGTGDNYGNGQLILCTKRGDGRVNEFILAETIRAEITSVSSNGSANWVISSEPYITPMDPTWPGGSGIVKNITSNVAAGNNLVTNGDFEDEDSYATGLPESWILVVGTLVTKIGLTDIEEQTVTINGTPASGSYTLSFTDRAGRVHTTVPLTYNASSSAVQSALNSLPYLSSVTVSSTGTSPNLTHTVVMENVPGPAQLTYTSRLNAGTITIATTVPGSSFVVRGARCLEIIGDGSTKQEIQTAVTTSSRTCYGFNVWMATDVPPAAGELTIDLVDGDSGATIDDDQGVANELVIDLTTLSTSPSAHNTFFHTPLTLPPRVYLRFRLTTALSSGSSIFLDEVIMTAGTELYAGGPYILGVSGPADFAVEDFATITISSDRAGEIHEWLNRLLGLSSKRVLLPTASPSTQPDSLIS